jgi:hypothetical protein
MCINCCFTQSQHVAELCLRAWWHAPKVNVLSHSTVECVQPCQPAGLALLRLLGVEMA